MSMNDDDTKTHKANNKSPVLHYPAHLHLICSQ